ncbi:MAG: lysozyme inhibitor LprI family protein [Comamonadaceae bacterium]|nr:lysozyme inhibitor LprI family protein [Comamonadaceae bacterium]
MRLRPLPFLSAAALALSGAAASLAQAQPLAPSASPACTAGHSAACTLQDFEAVRDATETLYGDVLLVLSAHERPALRADQAQWRRQARQHCQQQAPLRGDMAAPGNSAHHACMVSQHLERRRVLRQHWLMGGGVP